MSYMNVILEPFSRRRVFLTESVKWDNKMCFNSCECVRVYLKWRSDGQECVTGPVNLLDSITHMHTDTRRRIEDQERKKPLMSLVPFLWITLRFYVY